MVDPRLAFAKQNCQSWSFLQVAFGFGNAFFASIIMFSVSLAIVRAATLTRRTYKLLYVWQRSALLKVYRYWD
jgi:hypothetical protein